MSNRSLEELITVREDLAKKFCKVFYEDANLQTPEWDELPEIAQIGWLNVVGYAISQGMKY